jgi:hypothetical protein
MMLSIPSTSSRTVKVNKPIQASGSVSHSIGEMFGWPTVTLGPCAVSFVSRCLRETQRQEIHHAGNPLNLKVGDDVVVRCE